MNELLQKAMERRDALRRELEAIEGFILALSAQEAAASSRSKSRHLDLFEPRQQTRAERAAAVSAMMDDAEQMILREGRPLTRFQLLERLERAGHQIEGGDKSKVLGTNLWRSKRFHNIQGAGYWPKSRPVPQHLSDLPLRNSSLT